MAIAIIAVNYCHLFFLFANAGQKSESLGISIVELIIVLFRASVVTVATSLLTILTF